MKPILIGPLISLLAASASAIAGPTTYQLPEETADFKPGAGVETAETYCRICHSADYVATQPSKTGKAFWEAEVQKMIKVFKAPIPDADAAAIADYLASNY
jgi:mono/diheme cytochrome c family protein